VIVSKFKFFLKNEMYPHLINKINNKHYTNVVPNSNECWLDFSVSFSKPNHNIKTHLTFRLITRLIYRISIFYKNMN
jgi:hypothetical protein